jgi:hypothetical protein
MTERGLDRIRDVIHEEGKDLPPAEYKELEELAADIETTLAALKGRNPEQTSVKPGVADQPWTESGV